jgi:cell wall-associated NlpC family hydrolase
MPTAKTPNPERWCRLDQKTADLFRRPFGRIAKLGPLVKNLYRISQLTDKDLPLRIISEENGSLLVQTADGTFGWLPKTSVKAAPTRNYWQKISYAKKSTLVPSKRTNRALVIRTLTRWRKTPYLPGGNTVTGSDTAGMVQRTLWELTGLLLPRRLEDQKTLGKITTKAALRPLDVVFFVQKQGGIQLAGLYYDGKVWYICPDNNRLQSEKLAELSKRHTWQTARRYLR